MLEENEKMREKERENIREDISKDITVSCPNMSTYK